MASKQNAGPKDDTALEKARSKHARALKKVQATQAKLGKRTRKLRKLEAKLTQLQQRATQEQRRATQAGAVSSLPSPDGELKLRPARLIYNPGSGKRALRHHSLEAITESLRSHGFRAEADVKTSGRDARAIAKAAVDHKETLVIVAGGDSTVEEVAPALQGTKTTLGIIPTGTMNNIARSLGIPLDIEAACALLEGGTTRQIDLGRIVTDAKPEPAFFFETAGLGLMAIAFSAGQAAQKGPLAGFPQALRKLFDYKPEAMRIDLDDGQTILVSSQLITASNAPLMGFNFLIAPQAKMDDGLLDLAVYDGMGKLELIEYFASIRNGKQADNPHVRFYRTSKLRIRSAPPVPVEADKSPLPEASSLEIQVMPQALTMIVGNGIALSVPVNPVQSAGEAS